MPIHNLAGLTGPSTQPRGDACVIGTGFAGLLVARRLAQAGRHVIALESGLQAFDPEIHDLNQIEHSPRRYSGATEGRFRGLGGSSSKWSGGLLSISPGDSAARPHLDQPAWPFQASELGIYQREIETLFRVESQPSEPRIPPDAPYRVSGNDDFDVRWMKLSGYRKRHVGLSLRKQLEGLPSLDIWLGATVCDFVLDRDAGRIKAVVARNLAGQQISIEADRFVIAAGTIETTRLVLLLDAASRGRAYERCAVLGRFFQDHLLATVGRLSVADRNATNRRLGYRFVGSTHRHFHLELTARSQTASGVASAFAQVKMRFPSNSPIGRIKAFAEGVQKGDLALPGPSAWAAALDPVFLARLMYWRCVRKQLLYPREVELDLEICAEQQPDPDNRITLSDQCDALGVRKVRLAWRPTEADERTFRTTVPKLARYWTETGLAATCPIEWSRAANDPSRRIVDDAVDMYHPSGSTRMGTNPVSSVVDGNLRCHHVGNLSLASASTFPTAGSANPTYTIMQVALRAADAILQARSGP